METHSQACQDLFVITMTEHKKNGFFLEIGSNDAIKHNNSFLLEKNYNWKGLLVEYDGSFEDSYKQHRKNSAYIIGDARTVDYKSVLDNDNYPVNIDYLQIDLDVDNKSTLVTLQLLDNTVFDKYKFGTVTFEHDIYRGNYFDTYNISREIFKKRGYILIFSNVSVFWEGDYKKFEDWYVHPDLINSEIIEKVKCHDSLNSEEIKNLLAVL